MMLCGCLPSEHQVKGSWHVRQAKGPLANIWYISQFMPLFYPTVNNKPGQAESAFQFPIEMYLFKQWR